MGSHAPQVESALDDPGISRAFKTAYIYGLYIGIASIIFSAILYVAGQSFNQTLAYLSSIIVIVGVIWSQINYRKLQDGVLTYGQGVGVAVLAMLFAGILSAIYTILLYKVIDPALYDQYLLFVEETTTNKLMERGLSDQQIAQTLELTKRFQNPIILAIGALVNSVIVGLIVGLITSIFVKKKPVDPVD